MSNNNTIKFGSSAKPQLTAGTYTVEVSQTLDVGDQAPETVKADHLKFYVDGPKFALEPGVVHQIYPLHGTSDKFSAVLPSIAFNRVTLPWERQRGNTTKPDAEDSWLMLLLVNEQEATLIREGYASAATQVFEATKLEDRYQQDSVNYVELPKSWEKSIPPKDKSIPPMDRSIFPREDEYKFLSYTKQEPGQAEAKSVIVGNRLPTVNSVNTVYLISLEHRKEVGNRVRYAYLYKWSFTCVDDEGYFIPEGTLPEEVGLPDTKAVKEKIIGVFFYSTAKFEAELDKHAKSLTPAQIGVLKKRFLVDEGTFHGRLANLQGRLGSFVYPLKQHNTKTEQGAILVKEGQQHYWYRSPFQAKPTEIMNLVGDNKVDKKWTGAREYFSKSAPPKVAPYDDITYSTAFELGKMTALKDVAFHNAYFPWKQEVSIALLQKKNRGMTLRRFSESKPLPEVVMEKVKQWQRLEGIPNAYLIPSLKMLPNESIRTFYLDYNWINAFLLGAFSIGNTYDLIEAELLETIWDNQFISQQVFLNNRYYNNAFRFGILVNSLVVSGWPEYQVDIDLDLWSRRRLTKNVELFLFTVSKQYDSPSNYHTITFKLPFGKWYSGFTFNDVDNTFVKDYQLKDQSSVKKTVDFHDYAQYNTANEAKGSVVNISKLAAKKNNEKMSPDEFGAMLLEGKPCVEFNLSVKQKETLVASKSNSD